MPSDIAISTRNLTKTYRSFAHPGDRIKQSLGLGLKSFYKPFTALDDVSFDIRKGETIGIIGRNGSGKSTLLQVICGILKASSGTIDVHGRVSALLELGAGFNPEFTGRENVYFFGAIMGLAKSEMDARFAEITAFADIGDFIDMPVRIYSSGMYVRLAFAAAINVKPDILVVDEALSVGDSLFQAKCFGKIRDFQTQGTTVLLVTHSLDLVATHCERALLLEGGHLVEIGSPRVVIDEYRRRMNSGSRVSAAHTNQSSVADGRLWSRLFSVNPKEVRYGSLETEIIEAGWFTVDSESTQILHHGDRYRLKVRIRRNQGTAPPLLSYVIKDSKGVVLTGSNTQVEGVTVGTLTMGATLLVQFDMPVLLAPGHYLLSVGSQSPDMAGTTVAHDHRTDYLPFEVIGKACYGIFCAPTAIHLEEERT